MWDEKHSFVPEGRFQTTHEAMVLGVHIKSETKRVEGGVINFSNHWAARAWNMGGGKAEAFFWGSGA